MLHVAQDLQDEAQIARAVSEATKAEGASLVVAPHNHVGRAVAPRVAVRLGAGMVPGVTGLLEGSTVKRNVFSGKAMAHVSVDSEVKVITTTPNAFGVEGGGAEAAVESFAPKWGGSLKVTGFKASSSDGSVPLPRRCAWFAGRGLKGPEHWGIVEELATTLEATTACSRPVSDMGWRPTTSTWDKPASPSVPIVHRSRHFWCDSAPRRCQPKQSHRGHQHDPEAPFFKAADYGIVGDAFECCPSSPRPSKTSAEADVPNLHHGPHRP